MVEVSRLNVLQLPSVVEILNRHIPEGSTVVDPYSGDDYERTTHSNSPEQPPFDVEAGYHMPPGQYMDMLRVDYGERWADAVVLNPWHWNQAAYRGSKEKLHRLLRPGGVAVVIGWSSSGFQDVDWRYEMVEVGLVCWGAGNDLIITVERKGK